MYVSPAVVVGFHGCDKTVFDKVIKQGQAISKSENDFDWLGHGIYFWEGSYQRAIKWAKQDKNLENPAVIGAFIKLGNCIDLLDVKDLQKIKSIYRVFKSECYDYGVEMPKNKVHKNSISFVRELDCKIISRLQQINNDLIARNLELSGLEGQNKRSIQNHPFFIDSVRGMFPEGAELYDDAGFRDKNHVQLCIINPNCILGYFAPTKRNPWYKSI